MEKIINENEILKIIEILKEYKSDDINCDYDICEINIEYKGTEISASIDFDYGDFKGTAKISAIWCIEINENEPIWEGKVKLNSVVEEIYDRKEKMEDKEFKKMIYQEYLDKKEELEILDQELNNLNGKITWNENGEEIN